MIGLLQRVSAAQVAVDGAVVAAIGRGLLVLVGIERGDDRKRAERLVDRILDYRVFPDGEGRMNLCLREVGGELLLVPQFTLAADTTRGTRPSFSCAADPALGRDLFEYLVAHARDRYPRVGSGCFGAHMEVSLTNDGPVTFWLRVPAGG